MPPSQNPGFVYLARVEGTDLHKIGVSSDPERRVSEFGPPCELVHTVETKAVWRIESALLDRFSDHVTEGEWIECLDSVSSKIAAEMDRLKEEAEALTERNESSRSDGSRADLLDNVEGPQTRCGPDAGPEPEDYLFPLSDGDEVYHPGLRLYARKAVKESEKSQSDVARELDVHRSAVSRALLETGPNLEKMQARIVEHLTPFELERREAFVKKPAPATE